MWDLAFFQIFNYAVFMFAIIAYAALDGFDLGVGCMHLLARGDRERRLMINAIGPVWDGNTTWIVVGGGILFAAFPRAFSMIMEGFYTPVMLLLFSYMIRGAAIEFRGKMGGRRWRQMWDVAFCAASFFVAADIGLMLGHLVQGVPITPAHHLDLPLSQLVTPYPLLIAAFGLSLFVMHGNIYLLMKTEGEIRERLCARAHKTVPLFLLLWVAATVVTFVYCPHMLSPFLERPYLILFALITIAAIAAIPLLLKRGHYGRAFIASSSSIASLLLLFIIGTFPYFIYAETPALLTSSARVSATRGAPNGASAAEAKPEVSGKSPLAEAADVADGRSAAGRKLAQDVSRAETPAHLSLTLYNASSTRSALMVLALVATAGIPLAFFYGTYIYKVFRGKVHLDPMSY